MSFFVQVLQDAEAVENAAVTDAKAALTAVEGVVVTDVLPALETALLAAIEKLGQEAVAAILGTSVSAPTGIASPQVTS